jgi:hypothetical protein
MKKTFALPVNEKDDEQGPSVPMRFSRKSFNRAFMEPCSVGVRAKPSLLLLPKHLDMKLDDWIIEHKGLIVLGADMDACSVCVMDESVTGFAGSVKTGSLEAISKFFDPGNCLGEMWKDDELRLIHGNCSLTSANVVLIADDAHFDEAHAILQGRIGKNMKWERNVVLLEAIDAGGANIHLIPNILRPELEVSVNDDVRGWDDIYFFSKSLYLLKQTVLPEKSMDLISKFVENTSAFDDCDDASQLELDKALEHLGLYKDALEYVQSDAAKVIDCLLISSFLNRLFPQARNESLLATIRGQLHNVPEYRILVFGGSAHLRDACVLRSLSKETKFVCLTPRMSEKADLLRWSGLMKRSKQAMEYYSK